jgi:hypothetical protein
MDEKQANVTTIPIEQLTQDPENANKGTAHGRKLLKSSLKRLGAGRSVLLDKDGIILAGNKTIEAAQKQGFKKVVVVDTDGDTIVAVRRTDLSADDDKARELAIADNRVGQVDLSWDPEVLRATEVDLTQFFDDQVELDRLLNEGKNVKRSDRIDLQPPPKMMWVLLGIPFNRFDAVQSHFAALEQEAEISVQSARNE